jgi:hypothetical protein
MNFLEGEFLYINKPYRMSSFGALAHIRFLLSKKLHMKRLKTGHAGTLDPLATGVLILCTGKATKRIESLQYQSKENPTEEDKQPIFKETPIEKKDDDNQDSQDDGKVDSGHFNEGNMGGGGPEVNTEGDGTQVLPTISSIKYSMPSISTTSGQASSTQESLHDSDAMPEAEAGGPDLIYVSSTSRLSASLGVQEEEFTNMQKSDPAGTLKLLLSKRQSQQTTSSEHATSDSATSNSDIDLRVRQDSLLLKLTTTFVHGDVLKQIE